MAGEELVTYLSLAPEFGGTRFGPFEGLEVRLGSNSDRCHIVLPEALGVMKEHVKVIRQGQKNLILAPAERTAAVFLWKSGQKRPVQLTTPTAVMPGDAFSLVTADGPRFIIEEGELPPEVQEQRKAAKGKGGRKSRLSADALGNEAKRQAFTKALTWGPAALAQRAWLFVKSGAIFQPRYIITGVLMASGWLFGGAASCSGCLTKRKLNLAQSQVSNCKQELAFAENMGGDSAEYKFEQLAAKITRANLLGTALEEDDALRNEVKSKCKVVFANSKKYRWLTDPKQKKANEFADWRERVMEDDKIEEQTRRLVVWLAASPGAGRSEFEDTTDSESKDMCARGIARFTYRQAHHLGLTVLPDALVTGDFESIANDTQKREQLLNATIEAANGTPLPDEQFQPVLEPIRQGQAACLTIEGEDDRTKVPETLKAMRKHLGPEADYVQPSGAPHAATGRIAKLWASDLTRVDWGGKDPGIDFSETAPGVVLDGYEARGKWVLGRTAETIARAIVLPCLAVLDGADAQKEVEATLGNELPSPVDCLVLDYKLRNEE